MTRALPILSHRLAQAFIVALLVSTLSFFLMRSLPGDMAYRIAAARYGLDVVTGATAEAVRAELHLDMPTSQAIFLWWQQLLRLDLGVSSVTGRSVWHEIATQLGHTVRLALASALVAILIAVPAGFAAGLRPGRLFDRVTMALAVAVRATPPFLVGLLLILLFSLRMSLMPAAGHDDTASLLLPALTLGLGLAGPLSRVVRDVAVGVGQSAYFEFARTKGLPDMTALLRHGVRNAATPIVAYLAVQFAFLLEGVVVVETLFAWPGIGHALIHALFGRDVPMIQGVVLVMSVGLVLLSGVVDLVCLALDPRPRRS